MNPSSPFYCHPTTKTSLDLQKTECKPFVDIESLEKGRPKKYCRGLPNRSTWAGKKNLIAEKNPFTCNKGRWSPLEGMSSRKKFLMKVLIAMVIVAAAVGIGIGVSIAVGAGVWKSQGQTRPIGETR
jgi:hypothetical protein